MGKYIGETDTKIVHMNQPAQGRCPEVDRIVGDPAKEKEEFDALHLAKGYKICDKCEMK